MEEFEASDIVVQTRENEIPRLKHSCTPSTYKGVGEQVKFHMKYSKHGLVNQVASFKDLSIISAVNFSGWCGVPGLSDSASGKCLLLCSWPSSVQSLEVWNNCFVLAHYCPSYICTIFCWYSRSVQEGRVEDKGHWLRLWTLFWWIRGWNRVILTPFVHAQWTMMISDFWLWSYLD